MAMQISLGLNKTNYLADQKAFMAHLRAQSLMVTAIKSTVLQGLLVCNGYLETMLLEDEEEDALEEREDQKDFEFPTSEEFSKRCVLSFCRTVSNTTTLRVLEFTSIQMFEKPVAAKLIKDITKSAMRKYARTKNVFTVASQLAITTARASILTHVAIFLVDEVLQIYVIIKRKFEGSKNAFVEEKFVVNTMKYARRCIMAIAGAAAGGAIGTLIKPGRGTMIGAFVGESIVYAM